MTKSKVQNVAKSLLQSAFVIILIISASNANEPEKAITIIGPLVGPLNADGTPMKSGGFAVPTESRKATEAEMRPFKVQNQPRTASINRLDMTSCEPPITDTNDALSELVVPGFGLF